MVMLLEGRHFQFFVHKKLNPSSYMFTGSTGCINLLISSGVDVNYGGPVCALVTALEHRNLEMTSLLLDRGCDVNKRIVRGRLQHSDETCRYL